MPVLFKYRIYVISPVVFENGVRRPKVATLKDAGRMNVKYTVDSKTISVDKEHNHTSEGGTPGWTISKVIGEDLKNIYNDPDCFVLMDRLESEDDTPKILLKNSFQAKATEIGVDYSKLPGNAKFRDWINLFAEKVGKSQSLIAQVTSYNLP